MYIVIEEYIEKLSPKYDVIGVFNTKEEACILIEHKESSRGFYSICLKGGIEEKSSSEILELKTLESSEYTYYLEYIESPFTFTYSEPLYILIKSGIYTSGLTREQAYTYVCTKERACFECVIGVYKTHEEAKEEFKKLNDTTGFYFCVFFVPTPTVIYELF